MATFYTGVDKERYDAGNKFLPMDQFLLNYTPYTPSASNTGGITQAGVPQPYKGYSSYDAWLAAQRGGGDGPGQVTLGLTYDPNAVAKAPASGSNYPITEATLKKGTALQYEWPKEKEYIPSYITDQNLQDTYTGSTAYPV